MKSVHYLTTPVPARHRARPPTREAALDQPQPKGIGGSGYKNPRFSLRNFPAVPSFPTTLTAARCAPPGYTSSASPRLQQSANRGHRELRSGVRRRRRGPPDPSVEASRDRNQDEVLQPRFDVERPGAERGRSSPRGARRRETGGAADGPRASHSSALTPVNTTGSQQRLFAQRRGQHSGGGGTQAACCAPPAHAAQGPSVWAARGS
ncbi:unnamed protein product [Lampetra fluviatilis]